MVSAFSSKSTGCVLPEAEASVHLSVEVLDLSEARFGVAMDRAKDTHSRSLVDCTKFHGYIGAKLDLLQMNLRRFWSFRLFDP